MADISALLNLLETTSEDSWANKLFALAKEHGFEQTVYGVVSNKNLPLENAFLRSNYSASWRRTYDAEKLHYIDPTVGHCLKSSLPLVWEPKTFKLPAQKNLYEEACCHGIRSGITYPIHGPNGEFGVISFVADAPSDQKFRRELNHSLANLSLIRDYVFESSLKFIKKPEKTYRQQIYLTHRELECLKWVMIGKSSWEISMILHCSEATINFHMSNIRDKFQVSTRQQAVVKAIQLGILVPA
ncbi:MAG TPA: LuxR family transcriptional regulator [Methylophilaceae bacterium]|nr:LuxR family transcriptional regulator [Methylophilaceae bacterium]